MSATPQPMRRVHALATHAVGSLVFLSGAVAAACGLVEDFEWESSWFSLPVKVWALKVHGAAVFLFLICLGTLLPTHVAPMWRARRNRVAGALLLTVMAILILTGYSLYYVGGEDARHLLRWIHLGAGVVEPLVFLAHLFRGRRPRTTAM